MSDDCACGRPEFYVHAGWWRCRTCGGWLPVLDRTTAVAFMRAAIAKRRASGQAQAQR